jgi:hypothetical protein
VSLNADLDPFNPLANMIVPYHSQVYRQRTDQEGYRNQEEVNVPRLARFPLFASATF